MAAEARSMAVVVAGRVVGAAEADGPPPAPPGRRRVHRSPARHRGAILPRQVARPRHRRTRTAVSGPRLPGFQPARSFFVFPTRVPTCGVPMRNCVGSCFFVLGVDPKSNTRHAVHHLPGGTRCVHLGHLSCPSPMGEGLLHAQNGSPSPFVDHGAPGRPARGEHRSRAGCDDDDQRGRQPERPDVRPPCLSRALQGTGEPALPSSSLPPSSSARRHPCSVEPSTDGTIVDG